MHSSVLLDMLQISFYLHFFALIFLACLSFLCVFLFFSCTCNDLNRAFQLESPFFWDDNFYSNEIKPNFNWHHPLASLAELFLVRQLFFGRFQSIVGQLIVIFSTRLFLLTQIKKVWKMPIQLIVWKGSLESHKKANRIIDWKMSEN